MPHRDEDHAFESLSDLLGSADNLHPPQRDRFDKVQPSSEVDLPPEPTLGFDLEAFERSRSIVMPTHTAEKPLCLTRVRDYALAAHAGQFRRYTHEPYWQHLAEVAGLVTTSDCSSPRAIALAWLHHTVADTAITLREIERQFGASIANGVRCLTGSSNPRLTPEARKQRNIKRLAEGDADIHTVKLADMAVNLPLIARHDPDLARSHYLEEKRLEVGVLKHGDAGLKSLVRNLWSEALRRVSPA